jgi:opacity protein-like surface antigen
MRVKTFILATSAFGALALSAGVANAEPNGWYGAIDAGYHTIDDLELVSQTTGPQWDFALDNDWAAFARLGYRFDQNWRVEVEGGYRSNDISSIVNPNPGIPSGVCAIGPVAGPCGGADGEIKSTALMVNVIYDFGTADSSLRPFIGLGAGMNRVNTEFLGTLGGNRTVGVAADDSSIELAAQAIAGLAFAISDKAHLDLTYRYLMSNMETATFVSSAPAAVGPFAGSYENSHTVSLGLRYAFGADEPAPPPPPRRPRRLRPRRLLRPRRRRLRRPR